LIESASSLFAPSLTGFGAPSTRSFASLRPRPVTARTTLITWIFLSPAPVRTTSNAVCSSAAAPSPPAAGAAPAAATATGAAAVMPHSSSIFFFNSTSSSTVIFPSSSNTLSTPVAAITPPLFLRKPAPRPLHRSSFPRPRQPAPLAEPRPRLPVLRLLLLLLLPQPRELPRRPAGRSGPGRGRTDPAAGR